MHHPVPAEQQRFVRPRCHFGEDLKGTARTQCWTGVDCTIEKRSMARKTPAVTIGSAMSVSSQSVAASMNPSRSGVRPVLLKVRMKCCAIGVNVLEPCSWDPFGVTDPIMSLCQRIKEDCRTIATVCGPLWGVGNEPWLRRPALTLWLRWTIGIKRWMSIGRTLPIRAGRI